MIEYLKEILYDLKYDENIYIEYRVQKTFALENAIEILEKLRNEERRNQHGDIE